ARSFRAVSASVPSMLRRDSGPRRQTSPIFCFLSQEPGAAKAGCFSLVLMKRGQNVGYQGYLLLIPGEGQGMVVMTNSDNGSILAEALIRRAARLYGWPPLGSLP